MENWSSFRFLCVIPFNNLSLLQQHVVILHGGLPGLLSAESCIGVCVYMFISFSEMRKGK